jgi:hypothetical protein
MFKKLIPYVCITILALIVIYICFIPNNFNYNTNQREDSTETGPSQEEIIKDAFNNGVDGESTLNNMEVALISDKIDKVENMNFDTNVYRCDTGTAITLLLYSNNITVPLSQIEKVELRTAGGTLINDAQVHTFVLNNKKACAVMIKVEDRKDLENLSITVKTFDGKTKNIPMPTEEKVSVLNLFSTRLSEATYGDIVFISGIPYFVHESSVFESYSFVHNDKTYAEAVVGTVMVPMTNLFRPMLAEENFKVVYFNEEETDYGTSVEFKLNDEEMLKKYVNRFDGLYAELLSCTYRIETNGDGDTTAIKNRDFMIENTWYKISTEENELFKTKCNPYNTK